jgi:hypothetical protein
MAANFSLFRPENSLLRRLGNSLSKPAESLAFRLVDQPQPAVKSRNSLYFPVEQGI